VLHGSGVSALAMRRPSAIGLRTRVVLLVLLAVLPALSLVLHSGIEERRAASDRARESTALLTRLASTHHERLIEATRQFLATLAQLPEVRSDADGGCGAVFARMLRAQPLFADFGVLDATGRPMCASLPVRGPAVASMAERPEVQSALAARRFAVGGVDMAGAPPRPVLRFGAPVLDESNGVRAVVWAALDLWWLQEFASRAGLPAGAEMMLVDGRGTVLAHYPQPASWVGRRVGGGPLGRALAAGAPGPIEAAGLDGVARLYAVAPLRVDTASPPLAVAVGLPADAVHAEADRQFLRTLAAMGLVGLLGVLAAWAAGDAFIVRRVNALVTAASGLAAGRLDARTGVRDGPGPVGHLAREFDEMAETLERRQRDMERAAQDLRQSERRKAAIVEGALDAVVTTDHEGRVLEFNAAAERIFGLPRAEALGRSLPELILPPRARVEGAPMPAALAEGEAAARGERVERTAQRADGTEFPVELSIRPIEREGEAPLFTAFLRDITDRRRAEEELRAARDELQRRGEARTAELKDANERLVDWVEELQQRAQDMRLLSEIGDHLQACRAPEEAHAVVAQYGRNLFPDQAGALYMLNEPKTMLEAVATWGSPPPPDDVFAPGDCWALRRARPHTVDGPDAHLACPHAGEPPPSSYICVPLMAQGEALGILHLVESPSGRRAGADAATPPYVTARRQLAFAVADQFALSLSNLRLQQKLRDQAIRDPLTGLFNRRYMEESLEREMRRAARREMPLGVIMLDIDHFKRFNDTFGHAAGDTLLREMGALLHEHTRGEDIACRYGGEELTLILLDASPADTEERAATLREEISRLNVQHGSQPLGRVTASLGVAVYPHHAEDAEGLLRAADEALYRAKASGRDRVVVAAGTATPA
jgi:diguanylate cyclase (GGDEF)-like protein/PAS domain S-box-containing protein